jgi:hypothetical protein
VIGYTTSRDATQLSPLFRGLSCHVLKEATTDPLRQLRIQGGRVQTESGTKATAFPCKEVGSLRTTSTTVPQAT